MEIDPNAITQGVTTLQMTVSEVIGTNVRNRREVLGLTQPELGERVAKYLGAPWSRQQVFTAEKGIRVFAAHEIAALALALDAYPADLIEPRSPEHGGPMAVEISEGVVVDAEWLRQGTRIGAIMGDAAAEVEDTLRVMSEIGREAQRYMEDISRARKRLAEATAKLLAGVKDSEEGGSDA